HICFSFPTHRAQRALHSFPTRRSSDLWLSSTTVFEEILHSKVRNVSRQSLEKICARSRLYVQNDSFAEALALLDAHNVCIIAGIDRKSTRLNSSHRTTSYAVFCLKKKK